MSRMIHTDDHTRHPVDDRPGSEEEFVAAEDDLDDEDEDDTQSESSAEEAPPAEEAAAHEDYAGGPDDALGLYLRQMGSIRLLNRTEELAIATSLERHRDRFRRAALLCAYIVARGWSTLARVQQGHAPIDPTIDVFSTEEVRLSREQILKRMPHHLPLIERLLRKEAHEFTAGLDLTDRKAKREWRLGRLRRLVKLQRLMGELSPRTELIERWVDELTDMADEMKHLVRAVQERDHRRRAGQVRTGAARRPGEGPPDRRRAGRAGPRPEAPPAGATSGSAANWPRPTCGWWCRSPRTTATAGCRSPT